MTTCRVNLDTIETIKNFVNTLKNQEGNFELISGRYVIDAKSIMGIFSLDLSKPVELRSETGIIPSAVTPFLA